MTNNSLYKPTPKADATTEAIKRAYEASTPNEQIEIDAYIDRLLGYFKRYNAEREHKMQFSRDMALELIGKLGIFLVDPHQGHLVKSLSA